MRIDASPRAASRHLAWSWRWETSLGADEHAELAALLTRSFPSAAAALTGGRSWVGARPELRLVGRRDHEAVAHVGVIRRLLRVAGDRSMLVGDVGLVAVHPDHQHAGVGGALMTALSAVLAELAVPYGFLTCGPEARPFYARTGWTALDGRTVRTVGIDHRVEDHPGSAMLLPVLAACEDWPAGDVHRDGQEI